MVIALLLYSLCLVCVLRIQMRARIKSTANAGMR